MAVADKFRSIIDKLTGGIFEDETETDFYDQMMKDANEYQTVDNVALKPSYTEPEQKNSLAVWMKVKVSQLCPTLCDP